MITLKVLVIQCVRLFAIPWTVACQVPLSMKFSKQEYWSMLPFPSPRDLPKPGIELASPASPALAGGVFTTEPMSRYIFLKAYTRKKKKHKVFYHIKKKKPNYVCRK